MQLLDSLASLTERILPKMPIRLEDSEEGMFESAGHEVSKRAKSMWTGFADFALQDNVLEVAVGLMYVGTVLL
jgi:hypothetical protein